MRSKDEKIEKRNLDLDFDLLEKQNFRLKITEIICLRVHERRMNERRQQYKSVSEHIKHEDEPHAVHFFFCLFLFLGLWGKYL